MSRWLQRIVVLGLLGLAGTLAGCGTHSAAAGTRTAALAMSIQRLRPDGSFKFVTQISLRNRGNRPIYLTERAFHACTQSLSGGLNGKTECISPYYSTWEGQTIGKFFAFPTTLRPRESIQANVTWLDLYIVPMSPVTIRLAITSAVHASQSLPATVMNPYSGNLIESLLFSLTKSVDKFHASPYNPKHYWPTYDTWVSQSPLQPIPGSTARQLDILAIDTRSVTFAGTKGGPAFVNFGQPVSNPAEQYDAWMPGVLSSQYWGAPWGKVYYGVTANGTVFLTFTPPNVASTDPTKYASTSSGTNKGVRTGNGAWTNGNVRVFTVAHPNNDVPLRSIWG